jgi:hypothetical protein
LLDDGDHQRYRWSLFRLSSCPIHDVAARLQLHVLQTASLESVGRISTLCGHEGPIYGTIERIRHSIATSRNKDCLPRLRTSIECCLKRGCRIDGSTRIGMPRCRGDANDARRELRGTRILFLLQEAKYRESHTFMPVATRLTWQVVVWWQDAIIRAEA